MSAIETVRGAAATFGPGVRVTATSLEIEDGLDFESWAALGGRLGLLQSSSGWWVGDWLIEGNAVYGQRYEEAIAVTGLDYQTLANARWVCEKVETSLRRENLSWSHHKEVAALEPAEQVHWLDRAEREKLSVRQLRDLIAADRHRAVRQLPIRISISLPPADEERADRWRIAARASELEFGEWAARALDHAADAEVIDP